MAEKSTKTQKATKKRPRCIKCGSVALDNFYQSYNRRHSNGYLPYCKKCIEEEFTIYMLRHQHNIEVGLYFLCRMLDYPYLQEVLLIAVDEFNSRKLAENKNLPETDMYKSYLARLNNRFRSRPEIDLNFDASDVCVEAIKIDSNDNDIKARIEAVEKTEEEILMQELRDLRHKFGNHYTDEELAWLRDDYAEWEEGNNLNTVSLRKSVEDICKLRLRIRNKLATDDNVKPDFEILQRIINDAALKPRDNLAMNDAGKTLGMVIKQLEKNKPADSVDLKRKKYKDLDGFDEIIETQYIAPLLKSLGMTENEYVRKADEYNANFAISMEELEDLGVAVKEEEEK